MQHDQREPKDNAGKKWRTLGVFTDFDEKDIAHQILSGVWSTDSAVIAGRSRKTLAYSDGVLGPIEIQAMVS